MPSDVVETEFAFFCVADGPDYVPKAITALASVRRFHPDAGYFILGRFADDVGALELIHRHGMRFQFLDLSNVFRDCEFIDTNPGRWPSECFWWTYAYKILPEHGYRFSCALDGDILCVNPLDLETVLTDQAALYGVEKQNGRINSGVLFFDNAIMEKEDFFEKIVDTYETVKVCDHAVCTGYCREKGDQGLLWEIDRLHGISTARLDNVYNHMLDLSPGSYREKNSDAPISIARSKILHILFKPWKPVTRRGNLSPVAVESYRLWWEFAQEIWPDVQERRAYFGSFSADFG
jgi:hypothetical protein